MIPVTAASARAEGSQARPQKHSSAETEKFKSSELSRVQHQDTETTAGQRGHHIIRAICLEEVCSGSLYRHNEPGKGKQNLAN